MKYTSNWALGYADDKAHNSVLVKGNVILGAILDSISAGDADTRAFATYVLDGLFNFLSQPGAYDAEVNKLHEKFADEVRQNLVPSMNDDEAGLYMFYNTLLDNGLNEEIDLLGIEQYI